MELSRHDIDDIVQETALRAMEHPFGSGEEMAAMRPWVFVVARRLAVDLHRRQRRLVTVDEAAGPDVAQDAELSRVEDRHLLRTVMSAVAELPASERNSFTTLAARTPAERNRANVARHRARRRLRYLVGPLAALVAWGRRPGHGVAASGALAAAILPLLAVSNGHLGQAYPSAVTTYRPQHASHASSPAVHLRQPTHVSRPAPRHPHHGDGPIATGSGGLKTVVSKTGPAGSHVTVANHERTPDDHLLCVDGTDVRPMCVDLPPAAVTKLGDVRGVVKPAGAALQG
jgi:RNA polymerase sigma-70 factor (ECF subfamily)